MIVNMKKVSVIALAHHREEALHELQELGALHVQRLERPVLHSAGEVQEKLKAVERVLTALPVPAKNAAAPASAKKAEETIDDVIRLLDEKTRLSEQRDQIEARINTLSVWGEFDPARIAALAGKGVQVKLYRCPPSQMPAIPEGCVLQEIHRDAQNVSFAVVGLAPFSLEMSETTLPDVPLSTLQRQHDELGARINETERAVAMYTGAAVGIQAHARVLEDDFARADARDQMAAAGTLEYLQGFVPADGVSAVEQAARTHGWGLIVEDPGDEFVPTLIRNPRWLRPVEAVFNFIGTFPGYRERDISGVFYLFFSLYYAILIGDACYGTLFLGLTAFLHHKLRGKAPNGPFYLMYVLNGCTVVYGVLTGSYFGIPLAEHTFMKRLVILTPSDFNQMVSLCFFIALIHLALAHLWVAVQTINSLKGVAELAWTMVLVSAYFLAKMLILAKPMPSAALWIGGIGLVVTFVTGVYGKKGEELAGEIFQYPFKVINCFGDIASYMRLFAVGFAGSAMAGAFNDIATQMGFGNVMTMVVATFILVIGHALNLVLGLLSVMVHGLRLNMLEFSGHLGQEWSGAKYEPLRRVAPARS